MKKITIYCDGACKGNPGPGGWGVLLMMGEHEKELFGGDHSTTNNRMELMGAIMGLQQLKEPCEVAIYSDSDYLRKGMTEWMPGWLSRNWKNVKNVDLWKEIIKAAEAHSISWNWVKGHSGNIGNERADDLANKGVKAIRKGVKQ
jgi:ribonuclease HI